MPVGAAIESLQERLKREPKKPDIRTRNPTDDIVVDGKVTEKGTPKPLDPLEPGKDFIDAAKLVGLDPAQSATWTQEQRDAVFAKMQELGKSRRSNTSLTVNNDLQEGIVEQVGKGLKEERDAASGLVRVPPGDPVPAMKPG